jgi:translation initiation factor IF-1
MPKNTKGGKNAKKGKNSGPIVNEFINLDEDDNQVFARVLSKDYGDGRFDVLTNDGLLAQCHICGKIRRREWINQRDIVVISIREDFGTMPHKVYGNIYKGDILRKIDSTHYGKLKKIDGFYLLDESRIRTGTDGSISLITTDEDTTNSIVNPMTTESNNGFEWDYGEEGPKVEESEDESDASSVSHDSRKKEKKKKSGQVKKQLSDADIDAI